MSPAHPISLTDGGCAEYAVEHCEVWSKVDEEAPELISNVCQDRDEGHGGMFSRFSLSPSRLLNWDSTQTGEDCSPRLPFSIRPWVS